MLDALESAHGDAAWSLRGQVLEALALQPASLEALVARVPPSWFAPRDRQHPDHAARRLASRLGSSQPPEAIRAALWLVDRGESWRAVLTLWIQEAVLRGADLSGMPEVVALWADLDSPLAALPLSPHPLERLARKRPQRFTPTTASGWGCSVLWLPDAAALPSGGAPPQLTRQRLTSALRHRISAAFASARTVSNGRYESALFQISRPVDQLTHALIAAMPMHCFSDAVGGRGASPTTAGPDLRTMPVTAEQALAELIGQAANGGCYNLGWSGAWGRLEGWRALGGLCGTPADAPITTIAEQATACQWAAFRSTAAWFDQIMHDPTLVCLRPDRQTVAVFAGTDSD